jgi:hypothetical protein
VVFEEDRPGTGVGLICSERINRLALRRLELLLHCSGGIYFGSHLKTQLRWPAPMPGFAPSSW